VLDRIAAEDVQLFVDATGLAAGSYTLPVQAEAVPSAGIVATTPATVKVRLARR
jgi:YbbR domain-containing protein